MEGLAIALKNGQVMEIREAARGDARALIAYVEEEAFLRGAAGQVYF